MQLDPPVSIDDDADDEANVETRVRKQLRPLDGKNGDQKTNNGIVDLVDDDEEEDEDEDDDEDGDEETFAVEKVLNHRVTKMSNVLSLFSLCFPHALLSRCSSV